MIEPYYQDESGTIYQGHAPVILPQMEPESVQCVVTSPPYWGLRDYGLEPQIWDEYECVSKLTGIKQSCNHVWGNNLPPRDKSGWDTFEHKYHSPGSHKTTIGSTMKSFEDTRASGHGQFCQLCNAWRGSLGLEPTPELYVRHMVEIFREVRRVLRKNGTLWLNLGDSYATGTTADRQDGTLNLGKGTEAARKKPRIGTPLGLKTKDLCGIPWRVAFALQADGWYLRSDIIWSKPNPMPESVRDRPTKAHEYLFLLTKSPRYFFDQEAVKVPASAHTHARYARGRSDHHKWADGGPGDQTIAKSFEHMRKPGVHPKSAKPGSGIRANESFEYAVKDIVGSRNIRSVWTIPTAPFPLAHFATFPPKLVEPCIKAGSREGDTVLDPFGGSGTVGMVAEQLGRKWVIIDLSEKYCEMAKKRILTKAWGPQEENQANWVQNDLELKTGDDE